MNYAPSPPPSSITHLRAAVHERFPLDRRRLPVLAVAAIVFGGVHRLVGESPGLAIAIGLWCGYCAAFAGAWLAARNEPLWRRPTWPRLAIAWLIPAGATVGRAVESALWPLPDLSWQEEAVRYGWHVAFIAAFVGSPIVRALAESRTRLQADAERAQATSALLALQAQIEPHFLFNTLATLRSLIRRDGAAAADLLDRMTDFFRAVLPEARQVNSTLAREVKIVEAYMSIMQSRLGARMAYEIDIDPDAMESALPPLLLQPIVENAVQHGVEPADSGGWIRVSAHVSDAMLFVIVRNTGCTLHDATRPEDVLDRPRTGLANVRDRLAALHAGRGKFSLESDAEGATVATLSLPSS